MFRETNFLKIWHIIFANTLNNFQNIYANKIRISLLFNSEEEKAEIRRSGWLIVQTVKWMPVLPFLQTLLQVPFVREQKVKISLDNWVKGERSETGNQLSSPRDWGKTWQLYKKFFPSLQRYDCKRERRSCLCWVANAQADRASKTSTNPDVRRIYRP